MEQNYYNHSVQECLEKVKSNEHGLTSLEASEIQKNGKKNILQEKNKKNFIIRFLGQFADLMIIVLFIASIISIVLGVLENSNSEIVDGIIILAIVIFNAIFGYIQEDKAQKALEKLKNQAKSKAKVVRDGVASKIESEDVVVGDVFLLEAGDIIPADGRIIECFNFSVNESSLTGETLPSKKSNETIKKNNVPLGDRNNCVFMGCVVSTGRAKIVCTSIGEETEMGKICDIIHSSKDELTPLQKNLKSMGKIISIIILIVALIMFICQTLLNPNAKIINNFLTAVAISVAAIPESLPAVITVIMAIGVTKLASKKSIVKNLHSVEALGSCNVICSDKTGTITQNKMTVTKIFANNQFFEKTDILPDDILKSQLLNCMVLCNDSLKSGNDFIGDPTETALCYYAKNVEVDKDKIDERYSRIDEVSFDSNRKMMTTVNVIGDKKFVYTKGALDEVLKKCTHILLNGKSEKLTDDIIRSITDANLKMGRLSLRVLAFAYKELNEKQGEIYEEKLTFIGMCGMIDPPREEVKGAVEKCKNAGLKTYMITGDHKITAYAIAKEVGIAKSEKEVMESKQLSAMSVEELASVIGSYSVFTRVSPEDKVKIVEALKRNGKIVAMTGDGVNDAPSIKSANIGLGMGITGTDVTKEVADIIISDDNFSTIVVACEEGRKIYSNIVKTIKYLFSANIAEFLSVFIVSMVYTKLTFLLPIQILFINLITDSLPAISMAFEPADKDIMNRPPRDAKKSIFADGVGKQIIICGVVQTCLVITSFILGISLFNNPVATTMTFITLNLIQFVYIYSVRNKIGYFKNFFKNKLLTISVVFNVGLLCLLLFVPVIRDVFGLTSLSLAQYGIAIGLAFISAPIIELIKFIMYRINKRKNKKSEKIEEIIK